MPTQACARAIKSGRIVATLAPPVIGAGGCGIEAPLRLEAIVLADGTVIPMAPHALIRCELAEAIGEWIREDVAPLALKAGGGLRMILGSQGYECRGRNRIAGAKLSEHGRGNAFDMSGVVLRDGRTLVVERQNEARDFMSGLRSAGCARFTTVLGPGSDGYHESHMHVDLAERRNGYRLCQWELR